MHNSPGLAHHKPQLGRCCSKAVRLHPEQATQRPGSSPLPPCHTEEWQPAGYYLPPPAEPYKCRQREDV